METKDFFAGHKHNILYRTENLRKAGIRIPNEELTVNTPINLTNTLKNPYTVPYEWASLMVSTYILKADKPWVTWPEIHRQAVHWTVFFAKDLRYFDSKEKIDLVTLWAQLADEISLEFYDSTVF